MKHLAKILIAAFVSVKGETFKSISDLPYSSDGRLSTHLLVYPSECASAFESTFDHVPYGQEIHPVTGEARTAFFPDWDGLSEAAVSGGNEVNIRGCVASCVSRGTDRAVVHAVMPNKKFDGGTHQGTFRGWFLDTCQKVDFGFINYHKPDRKPSIRIIWIESEGTRHDNGFLQWGEQKTNFIRTFLGHTFEFEDVDTGEVLMRHTVEFEGIRAIGSFPSGIDPTVNYTNAIKSSQNSEWHDHLKVKRTFSSLGFRKGRLPDDVFASMGAFNYNNNEYRSLEEWTGKGYFVNHWEADVLFIQVSAWSAL